MKKNRLGYVPERNKPFETHRISTVALQLLLTCYESRKYIFVVKMKTIPNCVSLVFFSYLDSSYNFQCLKISSSLK